MAVSVSLPAAFDWQRETAKVLAEAQKKASKDFRWTRSECLQNAAHLAFLMHVFGRDEEALEVCRFLAQYQFTGNHRLWSAVEGTLALRSRLLRQRGQVSEAAECIRRIHDAGFADCRLKGDMLDPNSSLRLALKTGDKVWERRSRLNLLGELCFMIELGGSKRCPVPSLEKAYQENLTHLRMLAGADGIAAQLGSPSQDTPSRRKGKGLPHSPASASNLPTQRSRPTPPAGRRRKRTSR